MRALQRVYLTPEMDVYISRENHAQDLKDISRYWNPETLGILAPRVSTQNSFHVVRMRTQNPFHPISKGQRFLHLLYYI